MLVAWPQSRVRSHTCNPARRLAYAFASRVIGLLTGLSQGVILKLYQMVVDPAPPDSWATKLFARLARGPLRLVPERRAQGSGSGMSGARAAMSGGCTPRRATPPRQSPRATKPLLSSGHGCFRRAAAAQAQQHATRFQAGCCAERAPCP